MKKDKQQITTKIHLIISVLIVMPVSIIYGFYPNSQFDIQPNTVDENNFLKAIMGLYLAFSILWILGLLKSNYLKLALVTNVIFMLGLAGGRLLSFFLDGTPTDSYIYGIIGEFVLGFYGLWVLNSRYFKKP